MKYFNCDKDAVWSVLIAFIVLIVCLIQGCTTAQRTDVAIGVADSIVGYATGCQDCGAVARGILNIAVESDVPSKQHHNLDVAFGAIGASETDLAFDAVNDYYFEE